ncbi:hypothetical protein [Citricoccus sp. GCM10030269]|uniref:hypothetical protein n=1 Tax=Citricoccus sp. GCM10030269 TaxID=3273388 RepID=UPI0036177151
MIMRTRAHGSHRRRLSAAVSMGAAATLLLSACGTGDEPADTPSPSASASESTVSETVEEKDPMASQSPSATSPSATSSSASPSTSSSPTGGETQEYTTESGIFTWTLPADWEVEVDEEAYAEDPDGAAGGIPREGVIFRNAEGTVEYRAWTGIGPTDGDGVKPDVVEIVEAEELPDLPRAEREGEDTDTGTGPVWYQAALLRHNEHTAAGSTEDDPIEAGDHELAVKIVNVPEGSDPEDPEDYRDGWLYYVDPPADASENAWGTANFLSGSIDQDAAEEITGLEGEEATRAAVDSEEYAELKAVAQSMTVEAP